MMKQPHIASLVSPYIDKSEKPRLIEPPHEELKIIQKRIKNCLGRIIVPDNVFSGVKGKSYADNARFHVGNNRRNLYKIDLTAFFPSITRDTVYRFSAEDLLCSPDVAQLLTDLTTIDLVKSSAKNIDEIYEFLKEKNVSNYNHLISGAPTSQILSYLVNHKMFDEMQKLADDNGITMTVYVDDVTFSSENRISKDFRDKIIAIIRKYNYQISRKKVKRYTKLYPKLVTGVIIDATGNPVLKNSMRQKIILAYNDLKTNPENADLRMRLRGLLIAARQVNKDAFPTIYKFAFQPNESIEKQFSQFKSDHFFDVRFGHADRQVNMRCLFPCKELHPRHEYGLHDSNTGQHQKTHAQEHEYFIHNRNHSGNCVYSIVRIGVEENICFRNRPKHQYGHDRIQTSRCKGRRQFSVHLSVIIETFARQLL